MRYERLAVLVVVAALGLSACSDDPTHSPDASPANGGDAGGPVPGEQADTVTFGALFNLSGDLLTVGRDAVRGVEMAVEDINENGGIAVDAVTYQVELVTEDLQSDPSNAPSAAQAVLTGHDARVVFGPSASAYLEPTIGVAQRTGQALVLSAATAMDNHAGQGDPYFRTIAPDDEVAEQYAAILSEELDLGNLAALFPNDAIVDTILETYIPALGEVGAEVVQTEQFPNDETNFVPVLQRVEDSVDALFIGYSDPVSVGIIEATLEVGLPARFISRGPTCQTGMKYGADVDVFTCVIYGEDPLSPSSEEAEGFFQRFEERWDAERDSNTSQALYYYDYVLAVADAMERAGTVTDVDAIAEELRGSEYDGVVDIRFDEDGVNRSPIKVGIVEAGDLRVVQPIS